ncbi:MAG: methionyl-tRNA formyltransferase [Candidatus Levyibacteriota bacterium]
MNIVFFGSSLYSTIVAKKLFETGNLSLIVTIPDKKVGRKQILTPSPVKEFANTNNIPVLTTEVLNDKTIEHIAHVHPDFLVVADYGLLLPESLLKLPKYASLNVHHSLLPKYRGPSPAPAAILAGEKYSGVTIIEMAKDLDAGDIVAQQMYELAKDETTQSLLTKLNTLGAEILLPVLEQYVKGRVIKNKQDETKAMFTKRYTKEDSYIDSTNPPSTEEIDRMIRAFYPWPVAWTTMKVDGKDLRLKLLPEQKLQPEGKKSMCLKDFLNGYPETQTIIKKILPYN